MIQLVYLESARDDLLWMRQYYETVFPEGLAKAKAQFLLMESLLIGNPFIGNSTHRVDVREFSIPKTPFSVIYRPFSDRIEILRIWDERQDRARLSENY